MKNRLSPWRLCFILLFGFSLFMQNGGNAIALNHKDSSQPSVVEETVSLESAKRLLGEGKFKEALAMLEELIKKEPSSAEAFAWKGNVLGSLADQAKDDMMLLAQYGMGAMQAFEQAIQLDPNNITGRMGRGISNLMAPPPFGNIDLGLSDFQKVIELDPKNADAHFYLGLALQKKGDAERAKAEFQMTLRLNPDHEAARAELNKAAGQASQAVPPKEIKVPPQKTFAFTHVTIINPSGKPPEADMTVVVAVDRIAAIGKTGAVTIPQDADVIDAAGKYLIPGLCDMHIHIIGDPGLCLPLYLANGVTGIRYMGGSVLPEEWREFKAQIAQGKINGPRVLAGSPIVDGPKPHWPGSISVASAAEGRQAVDDLKRRGAEFVKVYSFLPREAYFAIADEAKRQNIPFAGHVPLLVSMFEASDAGQKSMEHLEGVYAAVSNQFEKIAELMKKGDINALTTSPFYVYKRLLEDYDNERAAALFALLARNKTWQVPTLSAFHGIASKGDAEAMSDPRLKYIPSFIQQFFGWQPKAGAAEELKREKDGANRHLKKSMEMIVQMYKAGVPFMAGTDTPYIGCFPGFSLHDELALLVEAGLTPLQALEMATLNPAKFIDHQDSLGTVERGKLADLVLLDANPLDDIRNTKKIAYVVANGRLYTLSILQGMLAEVEAKVAAGEKSGPSN